MELVWKLLCHFWYHWETGNLWWIERGASRPLLLQMSLTKVELPLLQFGSSQISPWPVQTLQNELYFQSKMCRSWGHNTRFSFVVPTLLGLHPSLDFEQEKSIQIFPLVSWSFCSISLSSPASLCIQTIWWTGWILLQSYPYTVYCFNFAVLSLLKHWDTVQRPFSEICWCCHQISKAPYTVLILWILTCISQ